MTVTAIEPEQHEELLTVDEVARTLRLGASTVRKLLAGDTPAISSVKIGSNRRVPRAALNAYIRELRGAA